METKACRRCRRLFQYIGGDMYCPICKDELENLFKEVKQYIYEHKNCTIPEVIKATGCKEANIEKWVREERLEFSKGAGVLNCEQCGAPIATGRFCEKCKAEMTGNLNASIQPGMEARKRAAMDAAAAAVKNKGGMRFIKN